MKNRKLTLAISYRHNIFACQKHTEDIIDNFFYRITALRMSGYSEEDTEEIERLIHVNSAAELIQILSQENPDKPGELLKINQLQLKSIMGYSYGTLFKTIRNLKNFGILKLTAGVSERGRKEKKVSINTDVVSIVHIDKKANEIRDEIERDMGKSHKAHKRFLKDLNAELSKMRPKKD